MDVRALDEADLADDALMRDYYELTRRSGTYGREQAPFWTFEELLGAFRSPDSGERQELFAAYDGGRMVGNAVLWSFVLDNRDKAAFQVAVDVPQRCRGVGRALTERVERSAKHDGRSLMMVHATLPLEDRDRHPYRRFAEACGYELSDFEVVRHLRLPVPDGEIQGWIDEASPHHRDYRI